MSFWGASSAPPSLLRIRLWDPDTVQLSNLHRQILFTTNDIGRQKAEALAERLAPLTPAGVRVEARNERVDTATIEELAGAALIVDATDSVETKFLVNDFAVRRGIPFCYGGAVGMHGQMLLTDPRRPECGCLRCLFADFAADDMADAGPTCREAGILGPVVGYIGFLQAELAAGFLAGKLDLSKGAVFRRFDLESDRHHDTLIRTSRDCPLHGKTRSAQILDLTAKQCPSTFLYTKLALEQLAPGEPLEVHYGNRESAANVRASVIEEGYCVNEPPQESSGVWKLLISRRRDG